MEYLCGSLVLCCSSITDYDMAKVNTRFWDNLDKDVASVLCTKAKSLGVSGGGSVSQ